MKSNLLIKFITPYLIAGILSFFFVSIMGERQAYDYALKQSEVTLYEEATTIAETYASTYYSGDLTGAALRNQLTTVSTYLHCDVFLILTDGRILVSTLSGVADRIALFDATDYGANQYKIDTFYDVYDTQVLSSYYPVVYEYSTKGYVVLTKSVDRIRSEADSTFNYNYITLLVCYALGAVFIPIYYVSVTRPIRKITKTTARYAKGDYSEKINIHTNDEIGRLSDSLDYMATELQSLNEYQKKFIANISHDFRSPLTSIKGYLEAMLDGTIPPELQEKYLNIVITETERLTKLTNNLLTINNVTEQGMVLDTSDFDIVDMIKKIIETFEGTCAKKKIKFKLVFSDKELYVTADFQKIEQVLYNLIDNAIKFSNPNSSILISANEKNDKIMISVKDFGIGIPKDSISKIWERFYKTDLSRGKDKKGTGLGLSIVKEIITAHNEYIDVISTEGVGTEFIFALPRAKKDTPGLLTGTLLS